AAPPGEDAADGPDAADRTVVAALHLVQALAGRNGSTPRLWLVSAGAEPVARGDVPAPTQALPRGMAGVPPHAHPELGTTSVDLDPATSAAGRAEALARLVAAPGPEDRLAFRNGRLHVWRLERHALADGEAAAGAAPLAAEAYRVVTEAPGLLDR